jgi:sterol desaturase/sphingolipid hydroxylase (fatty acid hydroxylase superfamily)
MNKKFCCMGLSLKTWLLITAIAMGGFYLFSEHQTHLVEYLPFLIFLACPLMHRGHHSHKNSDED